MEMMTRTLSKLAVKQIMKVVADDLNIRMGEVIKVGTGELKARITETGFDGVGLQFEYKSRFSVLQELLNGVSVQVKWRPREGEPYYVASPFVLGAVIGRETIDCETQHALDNGLAFRTAVEAKDKAVEMGWVR